MKVPPPLVSDDPIASGWAGLNVAWKELKSPAIRTVLEGVSSESRRSLNRYKQCRGSSDINWKNKRWLNNLA